MERQLVSPALELVEEEETEPTAANFRFLEPRPQGVGGCGSFSGGIFRGKEEEKKREC